MLIFPTNHVPPVLDVFHVGFGPDCFIAKGGWWPNYTATNLYKLQWLCPSRDSMKAEQMRQNLRLEQAVVSSDYATHVADVFGKPENRHAVVCITTETGSHAENILTALAAGARFLIVDKPLVRTLEEFLRVEAAVKQAGAHLFLTYNHQFAAPVHQIRHLAKAVGVRGVSAWFLQGWLDSNLNGLRQFDWRTNDPLCGPLDIWSHAENLASFVLGQNIVSVSTVTLGTGGGHGKGEIFTSGSCEATFAAGTTGKIFFDQAKPGHLDDIGVCVSLNDGRHAMWRLELGVDNLWISDWHQPDLSGNLEHWRRFMRGGEGFEPSINETFNETPPGHHDGWSTLWRYLFTAAAGAMYRDRGIDLGENMPRILSLPVPSLEAAKQTARFVEASLCAYRTKGSAEL